MGIYPEGTRCKSEDPAELLEFHAGSFKIAQKADVPVAVASIRYEYPDIKKHVFRPNKAYLKVIDVIPAEKVKAMKTTELADMASEMIKESLRAQV